MRLGCDRRPLNVNNDAACIMEKIGVGGVDKCIISKTKRAKVFLSTNVERNVF